MGKKNSLKVDYPLKKSKSLKKALQPGNKTGFVTVMSPGDFLHHAKRLKKTKEDDLLISSFKEGMKDGKKFKALKLLDHNLADGRHRATAAEQLGIKKIPVIDYRDSDLDKEPDGIHAVSKKSNKVGKATGGAVSLPLASEDPNAAFRRLIEWSFAVAPLFGRTGRAAGGGVQEIDDAIRIANEAAAQKGMEHEKGVSGAVEFAPVGITEPLSGARLPLGSLPKETASVVEPALQAASEIAPYFTPAAPIAAARDVAVGLREGDPTNVAMSALGLPGKAAKAAAIGASAFMPSEAEASPIDKALGIARRLTDIGHYSPAAEAAAALKQEKGPASQMIGALKNLPGVKPEELKWSGVESAFHPSEPVTRQQIMDYLHENLPQVKESTLGYNKEFEDLKKRQMELHDEYSMLPRGDSKRDLLDAEYDRLIERKNELFEDLQEPRFDQYSLPGGENYREVLLHLPSHKKDLYKQISQAREDRIAAVKEHGSVLKYDDPVLEQERLQKIRDATNRENNLRAKLENISPEFTSSHWDEPNVLGHLRMSDRTGPKGEKILHLEELQSDWGQKGRKKGFLNSEEERQRLFNREQELINKGMNATPEEKQEWADIKNIQQKMANALPAAPYVTNTQHWTDLGLKRALREAAEGGYDKMIWTPGAEQAARYDLSKHIDEIHWNAGNLVAYDPNGRKVIQRTGMSKEELPDLIGKEAAEKLLAQEADKGGWKYLDSEGLKVGGEGMQSFYDKIVPTQLSKLIKKLDPKAKIEMGGHKLKGKEGDVNAHVLHLTPELRERILEGLPAYERGGSIVDHAIEVISKHRK